MRLTIVTEHYPPDSGGVATSSMRIAESIARAGNHVQLLTFDNTRPLVSHDYVERSQNEGVAICRVGPFFLRHPGLATTPLSEKLRATFRRRACQQMTTEARAFCPDIILAFYLLNAGFLARFVAADLCVPCIVGVRGNDVGLNVFHVERFAAVRWTLAGADRIVCVNEHLRRRTLHVSPELAERVVTIKNAVALPSAADPVRAREATCRATGWSDGMLIAAFIGTLREKKGILSLLAAMESLKQRSTPVRLLVIGPDIGHVERHLCGSRWDALRASGDVFCTGQVTRASVADWAAGADVVVMPSLDDGLANGLLEGMALGLCPVASHIFDDVVTADNGLLFDQADFGGLAAALSSLASDRSLVLRLGRAAREHVETYYQPEREANEYLEIFRTALADSGARK